MENETQKDRYIRKLEEHIIHSKSSTIYSSNRIDILIITISTTALVTTIGFSKTILNEEINIDVELLKCSWLLFVISIVVNLLSQQSSYHSHKYDIMVTNNLIRTARGKNIIGDEVRQGRLCNTLNSITEGLNLTSLLSLIIGLITVVIFFSNNI